MVRKVLPTTKKGPRMANVGYITKISKYNFSFLDVIYNVSFGDKFWTGCILHSVTCETGQVKHISLVVCFKKKFIYLIVLNKKKSCLAL